MAALPRAWQVWFNQFGSVYVAGPDESCPKTGDLTMSDLPLSPGLRANLLALAETNARIDRSSARIATGLRVNGPGDALGAWLQARDLTGEAEALSQRRDALVAAIAAIQVAIDGAGTVQDFLNEAERMIGQTRALPAAPFYEAAVAGGPPPIALSYNEAWDALLLQIEAAAADSSFGEVNLIGDVDSSPIAWDPTSLDIHTGGTDDLFRLPKLYLGNPLVVDRRSAGVDEISVLDPSTNTDYSIGAGDVPPIYSGTVNANPQRRTTRIDAISQPVGTISYRYKIVDWSATVRQVRVFQDVVVAPGVVNFGAAPIDGAAVREIPRIGLGLLSAQMYDGFITQAGRDAAANDLVAAKGIAAAALTRLGATAAYLDARLDQLDGKIALLKGGADKLVRTDLNAEGAALLSAQTLRQTGVAASDAALAAPQALATMLGQFLRR